MSACLQEAQCIKKNTHTNKNKKIETTGESIGVKAGVKAWVGLL